MGRHLAPEIIGRHDAHCAHLRDQVVQRHLQIVELLIEMTGKQKHRVLQFTFAARKRALAEIADRHRGADRDRRDQHDAAGHQPANRIAPAGWLNFECVICFSRHPAAADKRYVRHYLAPVADGYNRTMEAPLVMSVTQRLKR